MRSSDRTVPELELRRASLFFAQQGSEYRQAAKHRHFKTRAAADKHERGTMLQAGRVSCGWLRSPSLDVRSGALGSLAEARLGSSFASRLSWSPRLPICQPDQTDFQMESRREDQVSNSDAKRPIVMSGVRARQGVTGHNVRYVLGFGLAGAIIALALLYLLYFAVEW